MTEFLGREGTQVLVDKIKQVQENQWNLPECSGEDKVLSDNGSLVWVDRVNPLTTDESTEIFTDIFGAVRDEDGDLIGGAGSRDSDYTLTNFWKFGNIDSHPVVYAIINNHKYIIAINDTIKCEWCNKTGDMSSIVPYTPYGKDASEWTFEDAMNKLMVANFDDYYGLDSLANRIISGGDLISGTTFVHKIREMDLGGYRWNPANFEVCWFLYKNYDDIVANSVLDKQNIWLPYHYNANNAWKAQINGADASSIKYNRNKATYQEIALPVALIY